MTRRMVHLACQYHLLLFDPPAPRSPQPSDKKHFYGRTHFGVPSVYGPYPITFMLVVLTEEVKDIRCSCQHMRGPLPCFQISAGIVASCDSRMGWLLRFLIFLQGLLRTPHLSGNVHQRLAAVFSVKSPSIPSLEALLNQRFSLHSS